MAEPLRVDRARKPLNAVVAFGWIYVLSTFAIGLLWYSNPFVGRSTFWQVFCSISTVLIIWLGVVRPIKIRSLTPGKLLEVAPTAEFIKAPKFFIALSVITFIGWLLDAGHLETSENSARVLFIGLVQLIWWLTSLIILILRYSFALRADRLAELDERDLMAIRNRQQEIEYERDLEAQRNRLDKATNPGLRSQYDADQIMDWPLPTGHSLMFGAPGEGLSSSGFKKANIAKGQLGEVNFAKALGAEGMLDRFATFWSLHIPGEEVGRSEKYESDIDCVIVTGDSILVVDLKYYSQGDVTWRVNESGDLLSVDNATGYYVGPPRRASRNMVMAHSVVTSRAELARLPYSVYSVVVFIPTEMGMGYIEPDTDWPSGIPLVTLHDILGFLGDRPSVNPDHPDAAAAIRMFKNLIRNESYWASRNSGSDDNSGPVYSQRPDLPSCQFCSSPRPVGASVCPSCGH